MIIAIIIFALAGVALGYELGEKKGYDKGVIETNRAINN